MTQPDYDQKKRECFVKFCKDNGIDQEVNISIFDAFDQIFDRAYALGKEKETVSQEKGEEMLTCEKSKVQEVYKTSKEIVNNEQYGTRQYSMHTQIMCVLENLFGSKCLPDDGTDCTPVEVGVAENATTTQTSAEPKFKEGDIVRYRYDGKSYTVVCKTGKYYYALRQPDGAVMIHDVLESDLEPLTEQEVKRHVSVKEACGILGVDESEATKLVKSEPIETYTDDCSSQCSSQDFDNSFSKERRLNIATQVLCAIIPKYQDDGDGIGLSVLNEKDMIKCAYRLADALIAECEKKGGSDGN